MSEEYSEIECKFPVQDTAALAERIKTLGLKCLQPCSHERNLRFDDADNTLSEQHYVLRLRDTDGEYLLTYKGKSLKSDGIAYRQEIETRVDNYDKMLQILECLGYIPFFIYEKTRSIYQMDETTLMLDHTPIGDYLEIEGFDEDAIRRSAEKLGLEWASRTDESYQTLFHQWAERTGYSGKDMVFSHE